ESLHLSFAVTKLREIAESHELQRVAGRTDLFVNLVAALQLLIVPRSENAVARKLQRPGREVELMLGGGRSRVGRSGVGAGPAGRQHIEAAPPRAGGTNVTDHCVVLP